MILTLAGQSERLSHVCTLKISGLNGIRTSVYVCVFCDAGAVPLPLRYEATQMWAGQSVGLMCSRNTWAHSFIAQLVRALHRHRRGRGCVKLENPSSNPAEVTHQAIWHLVNTMVRLGLVLHCGTVLLSTTYTYAICTYSVTVIIIFACRLPAFPDIFRSSNFLHAICLQFARVNKQARWFENYIIVIILLH